MTADTAIDRHLRQLLDAIDEPLVITRAVRDRDGRILDFRIEFVNEAAGRWAGVEHTALFGRIIGELLPEIRSSGYFDVLCDVVETGRPYAREDAPVADSISGGAWVGGQYDLRAMRLGDGYVGTWRVRAATPAPA